jgi:tetratricopeptide (TPR) repeat protein/transglutaminase-like putative cysteine protease
MRIPLRPLRPAALALALALSGLARPAPCAAAAAQPPIVDVDPNALPEPAPNLAEPYAAELESHRAQAEAQKRSLDAALPLLRAFSLRDRLGSLVPLARLYARFTEAEGVPPETRALARFLLLQVQRSRGRMPSAAEQASRLGLATRYWILGPFDNEGKSGCNTAYPPELGVDLAGSYPGKVRPVSWRRLPDLSPDGFIDLAQAVQPSDETVTYALTVIEAPAETRAVLHLGTSGASRLFVNGARVFADDTYHPPRFDQAQVAVTLRKGPNRVLLKLCQDTGPNGFYLRVSGPNGDALGGAVSSAPDSLPPLVRAAAGHELLPSLTDYFRRRAQAARDGGRARAEYAEMLIYTQAFDSRERRDAAEAAQAARALPEDPAAQLLAAGTADDPNERRRFLEAALAASPGHPGAAAALAQHLLAREHPRRALAALEAGLERAPDAFPLALLKARALGDIGLSAQASSLLESLARRFPDRPEVIRESARLARRRERVREAVALRRVAVALRFDDLESRRALAADLADLGDVEGALKESREINALDPWDTRAWLRTGEFAASNERAEEARAAFARAREIAPEDAELFERQGRALARLGDAAGAIASLERSLELKPQNPAVKEALKAMRREGKGFGEDLAYDAKALIAQNAPATGEDAVALADVTAVKVHRSGLASRFQQLVIRVQTPRGVESERTQWISYSPDRQDMKILKARVLRPDGSIIDSHTESERSLSDTGSRLYYDARARSVSFPTLAPGDVLELAWRLDDTANDNLLSDYFGDVAAIQAEIPKVNYAYVLQAPPGRPLYASSPASVKLDAKEESLPDGSVLRRWTARNVPKLIGEPGMPGRSELAASLHVSTYKDWDSVGRYYWGLVRDQLTPTEEIQAASREILAGVKKGDELAAIRAIYGFVVSRTRYVGLEFGIHGFKPYKVDKVLARRFGDCKDKASLMHALLSAAGIDSRLVLLRMRRQGKIDPWPASLAIFDHAILYVPKYDLWLDGTAELHGSRELPAEDRGAQVLVVEPSGGSVLRQIPEAKAESNLTRTEYEVILAASGAATLKGKTVVAGQSAPEYRHTYQAPATRRQSFEQGWSRSFPGLSVKELSFSELSEIEKDVELAYEMELPRFAQEDEGALHFAPFGQSTNYVESYAALSARKLPLVLSRPWVNRFAYRYRLPAGFAARDLPGDVQVKSPFGAVALRYRVHGGALVAEGEVALAASRVAPVDYSAFRVFLGQIDQALGRKITLVRAPATATR